MIQFEVPGRPVPAARMTRRGKFTSPQARRYLAYKEQVGYCAKAARSKSEHKGLIEGPVAVEIVAYWEGGLPGDADNLAKAVLDGCNHILWMDDRQVVDLRIQRKVGRPQRVEVTVQPVA